MDVDRHARGVAQAPAVEGEVDSRIADVEGEAVPARGEDVLRAKRAQQFGLGPSLQQQQQLLLLTLLKNCAGKFIPALIMQCSSSVREKISSSTWYEIMLK